MRVYHGSPTKVKKPRLEYGKPKNDYGPGFYCTRDYDLACEWACKSPKQGGWVNEYQLDTSALRVLNLDENPHGVLGWAATLMKNRPVKYQSDLNETAVAAFIERYGLDLSAYDVVEGYRADDSYCDIVRMFGNNAISVNTLEKSLRLGGLGRQVVLVSPEAFKRLSFVDAYSVDPQPWFGRRLNRNKAASRKFLELCNKDDISLPRMVDVLRKLDGGK